ncbi:DNA alkylation repair protein [Treponema sp.]|uniref:DNA alkylation repair protein n=1 Tax=Treponema sp. TaxID=166 RepID=UPI003F0EB0EF
MTKIQQQLFKMQDMEYKKFHARLIPSVSPEKIIGVRTPDLRKFSAEFYRQNKGTSALEDFFSSMPHDYYEENNLHGFLIERISDFEQCIFQLERFFPCIDNWATCDMIRPKVFSKNKEKLLPLVKKWISSEKTYVCRFGIEQLMCFFLDADFKPEYLELVASVKSCEYYVKMMVSWFFATALSKQWDCSIKIIEERRLDEWCHNKTIQKAVESFRITAEQKKYLRSMKSQ